MTRVDLQRSVVAGCGLGELSHPGQGGCHVEPASTEPRFDGAGFAEACHRLVVLPECTQTQSLAVPRLDVAAIQPDGLLEALQRLTGSSEVIEGIPLDIPGVDKLRVKG